MNQYPLWKNLLILAVILVGLLYALPNLFSQDPSIEVTGTRDVEVSEASIGEIKAAMENAGVPVKAVEQREGNKLLVRFTTPRAMNEAFSDESFMNLAQALRTSEGS